MSKDMEKSLNTAFASARMEGFEVTPKIEADCRMIVNGELSINDYIQRVVGATTSIRSTENVIQS